ncbi:unnamed protein product [Bursaphelenchus okinawaensis]|uniref:Sister chromatid cohesion protein DCC1 n=1 Tax=Bursaphelenchus okinawaensis TaxID=465554 RepID=A0A811LS87_9BILA|nr:unnamed protein product [Bursaphelenchus okinawaensis]CAG9128688.1 unnamed protein product [Bursaphelenchus okinawaensis]
MDKSNSDEMTESTVLTRVAQATSGGRSRDVSISNPVDKFVFSDSFLEESYKLIEVSNEVFNYVINGGEPLSLHEFCLRIALSMEQTEEKLKCYPIFEFNGSVFMLDDTGRRELFRRLVDFIDDYMKSGGDTSHLRRRSMVASDILNEVSTFYSLDVAESLINWVFHMFFELNDDNTTYCINRVRLCRELSYLTLKNTTNYVSFDEFEKEVLVQLPAVINFDEACLKGIAHIKTLKNKQRQLMYLNSNDMPLDIDQRLKILFRISRTWSTEDMAEYFKDFLGSSETLLKLLTNKIRVSQKEGKQFIHPL